MSPNHTASIALVCALALGSAACRAQRELLINSDPPGARIRLDDTLLAATTPARIPFKDYGVRRVTLYLDGYVTHSESVDISPPWYAYFPIDLLSEIVFPIGWHDRHRLRVKLLPGDTPIDSPDLVEVVQRAEAMRHSGPEGPKIETRPARSLPRETSLVPASPPLPENPAPESDPAGPPAAGGGG